MEESEKFKDYLTGFHNKEALTEYLQNQIIASLANNKIFSLLILDIDHFKTINDRYGHILGDEALKFFASIIKDCLKGGHFVSRYGGDEFVIIMSGCGKKEALELAKRIRGFLNKKFFICKGKSLLLKTSIGIAIFPFDANRGPELLKMADDALYYAKKHGRNKIAVASKIRLFHNRFRRAILTSVTLILLITVFWSLNRFRPYYENFFDLQKIYSYAIIRGNYYFHILKYKYNYAYLELDDNSQIQGWVVKETGDIIYITEKTLNLPIIEVHKKRIRIFLKIPKKREGRK